MTTPLWCPMLLLLGVPRLTPTVSMPVALPRTEPGTHYSSNYLGAQVKLEIFLDINCPDSDVAWGEMLKVAEHYPGNRVDIVVHLFPLPYHDQAHVGSQGFFLLRDFLGKDAAFQYLEAVLSKWYLYSTAATENMTKIDVKRMLAAQAATVTTISTEQFLAYLDHYASPTSMEWKYGARRGVAGTPWYFINGVDLTTNSALQYNVLRTILNNLLNGT